jgi:hypothetical protein
MNLHQLPSRLPIHPITGMRNDKVKRDVDTRASKGRTFLPINIFIFITSILIAFAEQTTSRFAEQRSKER